MFLSLSLELLGFTVYVVHHRGSRTLDFEWDPKKADRNRRKHGVEFLDAVAIFDDDRAITLIDEHPEEERYVSFGADAYGRVLAICYQLRGDSVRIISARKATPRERAQYEDKRI
jgi:uncharacterized DUF497 family protein